MPDYAASQIRWREVDSSNVEAIGWLPPVMKDEHGREIPTAGFGPAMFTRFKGGDIYAYLGVSRQRAVAASRSKSVGRYINKVIKPNYQAVRVT